MNNIVKRFMETQQDKAEQIQEQVAQEQPTIDYVGSKAEIGLKKGITTIAYGLGGELTKEEQEDFDRRKNEILELERQTDDLYSQNKDTLYGVGWLTGELAETLANPYEMATNIGIGVATGGSSIGVKLISNVLADAYVNRTQIKAIYDREPTLQEYAISGAMSVLPDVAGYYIGKKMSFNSGVREVGDSNVNVRAIKESIDDEGLYDGATKLAYQTQNNINYGADIADTLNVNNPKYIDDGVPTFLQRREKTYYEKPLQEYYLDEAGNEIVMTYSYKDSFNAKNIFDETVVSNLDEINAFSKGEKVTLASVRDTIKTKLVNFDRQKILVADEYSNLLGKRPQEYLDEIGYDGKDLAGLYAQGDTSLMGRQKRFWDGVIGDRNILSGDRTFYTLNDIENSDAFISRNAEFLNENGKIKPEVFNDDELLGRMTKSPDFHIIEALNSDTQLLGLSKDEIARVARTEFVLNKKEFLTDAEDIFKTEVKTAKTRVDDAILKPEMETVFDTEISPKLEGRIKGWETMTRQEQINKYYDIVNTIQRSTEANYGTETYTPFAYIAKEFNDTLDMHAFFFDLADSKYLKSNSQMMRDIFEEQSKEISMLSTFGTTSKSRIRNRALNSTSNEKIQKLLNKDILNDNDLKAIRQVKEEVELAINNTFFKTPTSEMGAKWDTKGVVRNVVSRGVMWGAGIPEAMTNPALAAMRAAKYGQNPLSTFGYGTVRTMKKWAGMTPSDLPNQKYVFAKMANEQRIYKGDTALKRGVERFDRFGAQFNEWSDANLSSYGDVYATSIIDNLKDNINLIDPEVKRVLRVNGITESNYGEFVKYAKDHIKRNGNYINSRELLELSGNEMADSLRGVFNLISDDVGNVRSNSLFRTQSQDELSKWLGMFRSFARFTSTDILNDMAYYTTKEGLKKSRLSIGGLKSTVGQTKNIATIAGLAYAGGKGAEFIKDLAYGDRDFSERYALAKTRINNIPEGIREEGLSYLVEDIFKTMQGQTGLSLDMLKAQAPVVSSGNRLIKSYNEANKDGDFSTDDAINFGLDIAKEVVSRRLIDLGKALYDTRTERWDESKRIYDFSAEENQRYFQAVFQRRVELSEINDAIDILDKKSNVAQAEADYLEDKTDSFDKLPEKAKSYFNNVMETANISKFEADAHKAGFALIWSQSTLETDKGKKMMLLDASLREEVGVTTQDVDNYMENKLSNFDNLSDKKKDYYKKLMRYMGKEDTIENRLEFYERLGNAKAKDVEAILKQYYNVDINQFYKSIGVR